MLAIIFWSSILKDCIQVQETKERESRGLAFTSFTKRENRHFHVVIVQCGQRNVQKSVMHVVCCLPIETNCFLAVLVDVAVVLA